jgi:asparagine synthetase B (glutamine-hydrolysing)
MVIDNAAEIVARIPIFEEGYIDTELEPETGCLQNIGSLPASILPKSEGIFRGLALGLRDYLRKTGIADKVVLGLSGGIDSTMVACIAAEALGPENVIGVTMPSEFSSQGSISDSEKLAENLGIEIHSLSIKDIYDEFQDTLHPLFE